ncbi:MAG: hypothetical protein GX557_06845 [Chloroflexi bacterium]|nr:hypothetical protein [Chloroflexota bacterium]
MAGSQLDQVAPEETLYFYRHPKRETLLRCSRCLKPICTQCAVPSPVGMRCPDCARSNRSPLYVVKPQHLVIGTLVALLLSLIGGAVAVQMGLWITLFVAAPIGGIIAEGVLRTTKKHGRVMQIITGVCIVVGAYVGPWLWAYVTSGAAYTSFPLNPLVYVANLLRIESLLYAVLAVGAAVARLH